MKTKLFLLIILIFSIQLLSQDATEIARRCVAALGGEEAIALFSDSQGEGTVTMGLFGSEVKGTFKMTRKGRSSFIKAAVDFSGRDLIYIDAFDGRNAWRNSWNTITDIPALNYLSDLDHTVSVLIDKQAVFSFTKEIEIEGKKAIGIEADVKGKKTRFFIDPKDFTILEIQHKDTYFNPDRVKEELGKRTRYSDYKKFGSVFFPTKAITFQKGKKLREYRFKKVTFKPAVSPSLFARPREEQDLRYYEESMY